MVMTRLDKIYARLESVSDPSVDQALAGALLTADAQSVPRIATTLLERRHPEAMVALVERFDHLPDDIQRRIVRRAHDLYGTLRKAANRATGPCPINTIRIIKEAKEGGLAYLVAEQLRHRPKEIQRLAADCLLDLAVHAATPVADTGDSATYRFDADSIQYLRIAVEEAISLYAQHGQPAALRAMFNLIPTPIPNALKQLNDDSHAAVPVLKQLLTEAPPDDVYRALLVMIRVSSLRVPALKCLVHAAKKDRLGDVLTNGHLLLDPRVAQPLRMTGDAPDLWPLDTGWAHWPARQTRGLARWALCVGVDPADRVAKLAQLQRLTDPMARLAALRALIALSDPHDLLGVNEAVAQFCHDADPRLARIALRQLIRVDWSGLPQLLSQLVNCDNPYVRSLASQRLASRGFTQLWDHWPRISSQQRLKIARALIKIDPGFMNRLARKLSRPDRPSRLRAISMIHQLNQAPFFVSMLLDAVRDRDEIIASAAVKTLGDIQSDLAADALTTALDHLDSRVRANAVEAMYPKPATRNLKRLVQIAVHDDNRPRANAIGVLLDQPQKSALKLLERMLNDPKPAQRISGLWLVRALGLTEMTRTTAEMSISDQDRHVRTRADGVTRRLMTLMKRSSALNHA